MFVYLVVDNVGYGSEDVVVIFANQSDADEFVDRSDNSNLEVQKWAVNESLPEWDGEE